MLKSGKYLSHDKVSINNDQSYSWSDMMIMAIYLCAVPPKNPQPQSNHKKKKIREMSIVGHSTK